MRELIIFYTKCMDRKDIFKKAIKDLVIPYIKSAGFKGAYPSFKMKLDEKIYFINFQFGRDYLSGKVIVQLSTVELSKLSAWAKTLEIEKLNYGHAQVWHRLGSPKKGVDGIWFDYENGDQQEISKQILELLKVELPEYLSKN